MNTSQYKPTDYIESYRKEFMWIEEKTGIKNPLTKPACQMLSKLSKAVITHNIIVTTRDKLCKLLGCSEANLLTKLKTVTQTNLATVETKDTDKAYIRIEINPKLVFRGTETMQGDSYRKWITKHTKPIEGWSLMKPHYGLDNVNEMNTNKSQIIENNA